ncbi:hypothetical protein J2T13_003475 [Paenibacillus sp. DS2015]|uniref:stalk domain-containing protein n=1 Tax=Paenibacillus sp. DS2015 TaxID=3373917 RepID=UPI003D1B75F6
MKTKALVTLVIFFMSNLLLTSLTSAATQKTPDIYINNVAVEETSSPFIVKGVTYVPIKVIEHLEGLKILSWDNKSKTLKISDQENNIVTLQNNNKTALKNDILLKIENTDENQFGGNLRIYFPEGKSNEFFMIADGIVNHYKLKGNAVWITWTGTLKESSKNPFLLIPTNTVLAERGNNPNLKQNWVYYNISTHAGLAEYGTINSQGKIQSLGTKDMNNLEDIFLVEDDK